MKKRTDTCDFDYWVIFPYVCIDNRVEVVLFSENDSFEPFKTDSPISFEEIRQLITTSLSIDQNDCYPQRFIPGAKDTGIPKDNDIIMWTSSVRLKDKERLQPNIEQYRNFRWVAKEEVDTLLPNVHDRKAFHTEFDEDTFWECLDTTK